MLVLLHPHIQWMASYQELLTSVSPLGNTREDVLHCFHDDKGAHRAVAWSFEGMRADSKMAVGLTRARIDAQEVEGGLRMSHARTVDVGENTVLAVVADMSFVVTGMVLD